MRPLLRLAQTLLAGAWILSVHSAAMAQDPTVAYPQNYSVALQNSAVNVIRVHYGPHAAVGVHDHSAYPTVYVYLRNSGPVRFQHFEAKPFSLVRPPAHLGAFRVSPGRIERHSVENLGDTASDFLRVELKSAPIGSLKPFRGEAPSEPLHAEDVVEYTSPAVRVERLVCVEKQHCSVKASSAPSLLVAFTGLDEGGNKQTPGVVQWLPAGHSVDVVQIGAQPAHLLRILLPTH